jgi:hypothetical protein
MRRWVRGGLLLPGGRSVNHVLVEQLGPWRFVEDARPAAFVIGQVVTAACIYVLYIDRVASRTHLSRLPPPQGSKARTRCDLVVGVVAEFGCGIVHLSSYFFEGIGSRARVLRVCGATLRRCFWERSGSRGLSDGPLSSSVDLFS